MPYIDKTHREKLDAAINVLQNIIKGVDNRFYEEGFDITNRDGDLNYTITRLLIAVYELVGSPKYHKFNSAVGVLECVKLELYRRLCAPYEDLKAKENGDIV